MVLCLSFSLFLSVSSLSLSHTSTEKERPTKNNFLKAQPSIFSFSFSPTYLRCASLDSAVASHLAPPSHPHLVSCQTSKAIPTMSVASSSPKKKQRAISHLRDPSAVKKKSPLFNQPQKRYVPAAAGSMTREELAAWRKEERRRRNRESAAASRIKSAARVKELRAEAARYRNLYEQLRGRMVALERHAQFLAGRLGDGHAVRPAEEGPQRVAAPRADVCQPGSHRKIAVSGSSERRSPGRTKGAFEITRSNGADCPSSGKRDATRGHPIPQSVLPLSSLEVAQDHSKQKSRTANSAEDSRVKNYNMRSSAAATADPVVSVASAEPCSEGNACVRGTTTMVSDPVLPDASTSVPAERDEIGGTQSGAPADVFEPMEGLFGDSKFNSNVEDDHNSEDHFLDLLLDSIGEFDPDSLDLVCTEP